MNKGFVIFLCLVIGMVHNFYGQDLPETAKSISIGLLVNKENEQEAIFGASLAVKELNDQGGIYGKELTLIIRSAEGSWGSGSAQVVDLVFNEDVRVILGSLEGKNMHMAEQVIAKTRLPIISVWASESSLSRAFVPWFFSIVPTDDQQAAIILDDLSTKTNCRRLLVIYEPGYDGLKAYQSLSTISKNYEGVTILPVEYKQGNKGISGITEPDPWDGADALILLGNKLPFLEIQEQLKKQKIKIPVYVNQKALASLDVIDMKEINPDNMHLIGCGDWLRSRSNHYQMEFQKEFKYKPGIVGAYAYDGVMMVSKALKASVKESRSLQQTISEIQYQGLTGPIEFDGKGRLKIEPGYSLSDE